jgi:GAF domain-containing protein
MKQILSRITYKSFFYLITFLFIGLFLLLYSILGEAVNVKIYILTGLFFLLFVMVVGYMQMNVINPIKLLEKQVKKIKNYQLEELLQQKEGHFNTLEYIISKLLLIIRRQSDEIKNATDFIQEIENGKLDVGYKGISAYTESNKNSLAKALLSMRDQMLVISEQEKERNWATEGLAKFANILRVNSSDIKLLYEDIICNIVKYVGANQGGLYLVNQEDDTDTYIDLVAFYAYERKKYINQRYDIQEGLLGQSYMEKDIIFLTDIPQNYTHITSGTGGATPNCILIVPLLLNEEVYGLLELASFKVILPYQIDFLKKLSENIASTISNVKITTRTQRLLHDSQNQSENLRNQEEELRQNMEELSTTQEEMIKGEQVHLQEIERLQKLHEENLHHAQLKNEALENAEHETKELLAEMQASQEEITKNYNILFEKFNEQNILSKFDQLTSIRSTKKRNVEDYFNNIRNQIKTYSEDKMIIDAMKAFKAVFHDIGKNIPTVELEKMKAVVKEYYETEFLPRLNANTETPEKLDKYWDSNPRTILMQYLYIAGNKNETGKKQLLDYADDGSEYSKIHSVYHPIIRSFLETFGYYDIFLIDSETGHLVYSVFKEVDYTTSLLSGPYKNTNFAQVFRDSRNAQEKNFIKLVDFEPYDPSYTAPASFISTPIFDGDEKIGVLIFQMPIDKINSIMTGDNKWTEDGLGTSGETYLVGEDYKMRSISRFLIEDPIGYFNELQRIGYNKNSIGKIKKLNTTILLQDVKTEAVINALRGNQDKKIVDDYRGISVLSAYAKLNIQDVNWVICSDIDEAEVKDSVAIMKELALKE